MKKARYNRGFILALTAIAGLLLTSCKDEPDKYEVAGGTPTINYIRCLSTEIVGNNDAADTHYTNGELVTSASPQSLLCLVGENLRSVYEMYFNDQKAILNSSYITDNTLIVTVPRSIPQEVSDKIYMITQNKDTITYDFQIIIPAPTVTSMSSEYAGAGTTATLYGSYFIDDPNVPLTVTFPNGVQAENVKINDSYSEISFTVPECEVSGPITVSNIYGTVNTTFYYKDTRGMLFDFDTPNAETGVVLGNHGWHARDILSDETSLSGNFVQLGDAGTTLDEKGGWNDSKFSFEYWPGNWQDPENYQGDGVRLTSLADFSKWENMAYKFEMFIPSSNPWKSGAMQIIVGGVDKVTNGSNGVKDIDGTVLGGANNTYFNNDELPRALYRPWTTTGSYDTGDRWVTVTIPIKTSFTYGMSGAAATGSLKASDFTSLVIFVVGGGVNGTECNPIIKIDNIRAVPYN
jgi:hypothetical protein